MVGVVRNRIGFIAACLLAAIPVHHLAATLVDAGETAPAASRVFGLAGANNQYAATPREPNPALTAIRGGRNNGLFSLAVAVDGSDGAATRGHGRLRPGHAYPARSAALAGPPVRGPPH
jgi:hypothetical protein